MGDSDAEDIDEIRKQKIRELRRQAGDGDGGTGTRNEPVRVGSDDEFRELIADGVVLVDFYADWCGPCKMLDPTVADVAAETDATVAKVDIDAHQGLAGEFGVQSVPTLYLFADGQAVERLVGVQGKDTLVELVGRHT